VRTTRLIAAIVIVISSLSTDALGGSPPGLGVETSALNGASGSDLLTPGRDATANWRMAGLLSVGGIPPSTRQCGSTLTPSGRDDTAAINASIAACSVTTCPSGKFINLGSGTFLIDAAGTPVRLNKCVVLRGQGPGVTILHSSDGAVLNSVNPGAHNAAIVKAGGSAAIAATTALTSDGTLGATSIQVASTAGFVVGGLVHVDELANGQAMPDCCFNNGKGTVWAEPDYRVVWNSHNPTVMYFDSTCVGQGTNGNHFSCDSPGGDACAYSVRCGGVTEELHLITAVNRGTNTITFDSPLTISYRVANSAAAHSYPPSSLVFYAGVEKMTVSNGDQGNLGFAGCVYCWAHAVESTQWLNAGGFFFYNAAFRDQVDFSYVHNAAWPVNGGGGYAINLTFGTSEDYIFDNIDMLANKVDVVRASGAGTVFAYNYMDDAYINGIDNWVETGMNCSHLVGSHHVLFEGNWGFNSDNDFTHGSVNHCTWFRNYMAGFRRAFTALDGTLVDDINSLPGGNGPLRAVGDHGYSYWDSFIGNVAGTSGKVSSWKYRCASGGADSGCTPGTLFNLGWNDTSVAGSLADGSMEVTYPTSPTGADLTITGPGCVTSGESCAPIVDGNFDFGTNTIQWASNDTARVLPDSMYLTRKPAFFDAGRGYTWPWVNPTGSPPLYTLPAKSRYDAGTPFMQP
jgi:hypothetical protein